jgi:hypothetical protein
MGLLFIYNSNTTHLKFSKHLRTIVYCYKTELQVVYSKVKLVKELGFSKFVLGISNF